MTGIWLPGLTRIKAILVTGAIPCTALKDPEGMQGMKGGGIYPAARQTTARPGAENGPRGRRAAPGAPGAAAGEETGLGRRRVRSQSPEVQQIRGFQTRRGAGSGTVI